MYSKIFFPLSVVKIAVIFKEKDVPPQFKHKAQAGDLLPFCPSTQEGRWLSNFEAETGSGDVKSMLSLLSDP